MAGIDRYAPTRERQISDREARIVADTMQLFNELTTYRNVHAAQWEEASQLIDPDSRNTFFYGSYNFPGMKKTQRQVDSTGAMALMQFSAIVDSLVTPKTWLWHGFEGDPYVMKDRATREYFEQLRDLVFRFRYANEANFAAQNFSNWKSLGAYGNAVMYVDEFDRRWSFSRPGLRYRSVPLGECFFAENHQHQVTTLVRWFRRTARQAVEEFGIDRLPGSLRPALERDLQTPFQFLHCVKPRDLDEYDPERIDEKGKPFESYYVSIEGKCLMAPESGYRVFPYGVSRYIQTAGEVYARGPAQLVLPALKTLNAQKTVFLKTGHRAADPVMLAYDDGLLDGFSLRPGALNKGGMSAEGKRLIDTLPTGSIQITEEMMQKEEQLLEAMFLTSPYKTLTQHPEMTATQVIELLNERGMLVAPTLGRQHTEYVGGLVPREVDLLGNMRDRSGRPVLPPMPPRLKEAFGEYRVTDTSPLAMAAQQNEAAGFMRWAEQLHQWSAMSGDQGSLDAIAFDRAGPDIGRIQGVRESWISTPQEIAAKRDQRGKMMQNQQQIQAMPAIAAMRKADAAQFKAGMQPQGQGQPQAPQAPAQGVAP